MSALTLLYPTVAAATVTTPALRRSEQLDIRRMGKVSDDERSVLRVEWRASISGADEARTVRNMIDSLRRMEEAVGEISSLIRGMPVQRPDTVVPAAVAAVKAEPLKSGDLYTRLALAGLLATGLAAVWWFPRRNSVQRAPLEISPAPDSSPVRSTPRIAPAFDLSPARPPATRATPVMPVADERHAEPHGATAVVEAASSPAPVANPEAGRVVVSAVAGTPSSPAPPLAAASPVIDFLLEEADPEVVARENAKLEKLKTGPHSEAPAEAQKSSVEPTLQLAEIMLSMGLEKEAAQTLIEYTEANPRHAVYHWLKLLGIYRSKGLHKEFRETADKLRRHFNIHAEDSATPAAGEAPTLENFPRVAQHVQDIWRRPEECIDYLRHLLEDNREGSRAGFPSAVAEEILLLKEIQKEYAA